MPAAAETSNFPAAASTKDALVAENKFNAPAAETPQIRHRFTYSNQILIADKGLFWYQHDNTPSNVIVIFDNDIIYGHVVSVPHPIEKKFDFRIKWDMPRLPYGFIITKYPLSTSVSNTRALKLHLKMDINNAKTSNYTFTVTRAQIVQSQVQAAASTHCRSRFPQKISRQSAGVPIIKSMQPVRVPYNNVEDYEEEDYNSSNDGSK